MLHLRRLKGGRTSIWITVVPFSDYMLACPPLCFMAMMLMMMTTMMMAVTFSPALVSVSESSYHHQNHSNTIYSISNNVQITNIKISSCIVWIKIKKEANIEAELYGWGSPITWECLPHWGTPFKACQRDQIFIGIDIAIIPVQMRHQRSYLQKIEWVTNLEGLVPEMLLRLKMGDKRALVHIQAWISATYLSSIKVLDSDKLERMDNGGGQHFKRFFPQTILF